MAKRWPDLGNRREPEVANPIVRLGGLEQTKAIVERVYDWRLQLFSGSRPPAQARFWTL